MGVIEGEGGSDTVPNASQVLLDVAKMATDIEEEEATKMKKIHKAGQTITSTKRKPDIGFG